MLRNDPQKTGNVVSNHCTALASFRSSVLAKFFSSHEKPFTLYLKRPPHIIWSEIFSRKSPVIQSLMTCESSAVLWPLKDVRNLKIRIQQNWKIQVPCNHHQTRHRRYGFVLLSIWVWESQLSINLTNLLEIDTHFICLGTSSFNHYFTKLLRIRIIPRAWD